MIRKFLIFVLLILVAGGIAYYYFFGFYIRLVNESMSTDIENFSCESSAGDVWFFGSISRQNTFRKIMFLDNGVALTCNIEIDGKAVESRLVVGYFDWDANDVEITVSDIGHDVMVKAKEL